MKSILMLGAPLLLAACGLMRTPYHPPAVQTPAEWQYAPQATAASGGMWWRNFQDPVLDTLVEAALARNNDLAVAALKVRRAQLQAGLAQADLHPTLSGTGSFNRNRALNGERATTRSTNVELAASWELDLWGRLSSARDAADWQAAATEQDRQSAALSLIGTTAKLYWQTAFLNQRMASSRESIAYARRTLELVQTQYEAGGASGLEIAEAKENLAGQEAAYIELQQQKVEAVNGLTILFDGPPDRVAADPQRLPQGMLPGVDAGLPAGLLGRRPDLRAAEARLRAAMATSDATRASYYPSLSLTGALGSASNSLGNLLANPVAALGSGLSLPFLNWNQMRLNLRIAEADYEILVAQFRQALYQAMADVENTLSARAQLARRARLLEAALEASRDAERLYEVRYRAGAVALRVWLDAQEKRRNAEIAVDDNRLQQLRNQVDVYQALGGDAAVGQ
ncbi:efflux transporter outer membrane subunit [Bordetella avium]|uniref:Multidrug efflux outer membrane lipoprotein n=1 Tax=Bordetella avium (strain 197N) TaxID=360910 RepID=Q2KVS9_BORA1|nr:efflux transporter outer membrane subunit [Bordetella avium]AZY53575.1 RND transporter [Bordetella avium]RIQ52165.1 efflux transporter outer membrane subunit [Bordetella avium]RIQ68353.1 efflux transporter outer membrane subunit [Bordetella avium]CAJ50423.1 multidrug efflux outer membrane lipoprotein [Bordetella avium 197N]